MARAYRCHARSAPAAARRAMLRMADEELAHARTLLTAHYLMTGKFYQPPAAAGQEPPLPWCQLLRELFQRLSRAEYGHAAMLLHVLESSLTSGNNLLK